MSLLSDHVDHVGGHKFRDVLNERQSNLNLHIFGLKYIDLHGKRSAWYCRVPEHLWFGGRKEQSRFCRRILSTTV